MDNSVLVIRDFDDDFERDYNTLEMNLLSESAGVNIVSEYHYKRDRPDPNTYMGKGHVEMLGMCVAENEADVVIFSDDLRPAQIRNLEKAIDCRVIDRTQLILDIFAQRAKSNEGKLQVELAQLEYLLPRLTGKGIEMSRIGGASGGGVATRGPGETKLEVDRRRIRTRISSLKEQIDDVARQRTVSSSKRRDMNVPMVSLVGYTSAGKSTLLNTLSGSDVEAHARLFATLDPTTRRVDIPGGTSVFLTDTVGFLSRLPHGIIAAFKATLEEAKEADFLIHVVDASNPSMHLQIESVNEVLKEIEIIDKPTITLFNKCDKVDDTYNLRLIASGYKNAVCISALTGDGRDELFETMKNVIESLFTKVKVIIPFNRGDLVAMCHKDGNIKVLEHLVNGTYIEADVPSKVAYYLQDFQV